MSVYDEIRQSIEKVAERVSSATKGQYDARLRERKKDDEYYAQLALDAKEAGDMLHSSAFPRARNYYDQSIRHLYRSLKEVWLLADIDDKEQAKRSIQIASRIDQLESLRNRPQKLVDETKKYKREE